MVLALVEGGENLGQCPANDLASGNVCPIGKQLAPGVHDEPVIDDAGAQRQQVEELVRVAGERPQIVGWQHHRRWCSRKNSIEVSGGGFPGQSYLGKHGGGPG